jgi:nucleoside-diphosphate-sugar epimerase
MLDHRPAIPIDAGLAGWRWTRSHVDDVVDALTPAAVHPAAAGRIYNGGERDTLTERAWIERIASVAGWSGRVVPVEPQHVPPSLRLPFDWQHHLVVDTSRIRRELGYAERNDPPGAMTRTVEWERANPPAQAPAPDYDAEDRALTSIGVGSRQ